jgi:hypothetical protein
VGGRDGPEHAGKWGHGSELTHWLTPSGHAGFTIAYTMLETQNPTSVRHLLGLVL